MMRILHGEKALQRNAENPPSKLDKGSETGYPIIGPQQKLRDHGREAPASPGERPRARVAPTARLAEPPEPRRPPPTPSPPTGPAPGAPGAPRTSRASRPSRPSRRQASDYLTLSCI